MVEESIIGFDIRKPYQKNPEWFKKSILKQDIETVVSIDDFVFPEVEEVVSLCKENTVGFLLSLPDSVSQDKNYWNIALAIDKSIKQELEQKFGQKLIDHDQTVDNLLEKGWEFLGYDIVDINGMISGLTNCGYTTEHKAELLEFLPLLNKFGLFNDRNTAQDFCKTRDIQITEHAPFYPVAIYRK